VALSGGGDSLSLLLAAKAWADRAGREVIAFAVDHRLQSQSKGWADWCVARAERLGVACRILVWQGDKPVTGLAARARAARHRLLAEAARAAGARVILIGHTADDVLEAEAMRLEGLSVPSPAPWSPSPAWPQGRGLFLCRPLLAVRREAIRTALASAGETWIDDPANTDPRQPRARMRALIAAAGGRPRARSPAANLAPLCEAARWGPAGELTLPLPALRDASADAHRRFLAAAIACVSGGGPPARGPFFHRLVGCAGAVGAFSSTIGGVRAIADGTLLRLVREVADARARAAASLKIVAGETGVFDGRFEACAHAEGLELRALHGLAARLDASARARLREIPAPVRPALPALVGAAGEVTLPTLAADPRLEIKSLAGERLAAACGLIHNEAEIGARHGFPV
jgi:tRNA(Ile)-lysidine synthase